MKTKNETPITELDNLMAVETIQPIKWIISAPKRKRQLIARSKKPKVKK